MKEEKMFKVSKKNGLKWAKNRQKKSQIKSG